MLNRIIIHGRLTKDPELRYTQSGKPVASFTVAVDRQKDGADFFDVTAWDKLGETASKYLGKGREVIVQGRMQSNAYEDKNGNKRTAWGIQAETFDFCGSKKDSGGVNVEADTFTDIGEEDGQLPF